MKYKILEAHITMNPPHSSYIVIVAIQSDPGEKQLTHFKAYYKLCEGSEIKMDTFQHVAAVGTKLSEHRAKEVFSGLHHLGYY